MPNWCLNKLTITGQQADIQAFKTKAVGHSPWEAPEGEPDVLNFHSLVPVPDEVLQAGYESVVFGQKAAWRANQELRECFGVPALVEQNCNPVVTQL